MKKALAIILTICTLFCSLTFLATATEADIQSTDSEDDAYFKSKEYLSFLELEHALATHGKVQFNREEEEDGNFDDCHILVSLNIEDDDHTKYVDAAYFPELEIDEIEDISIEGGIYHYVQLLITLKNKGKSNVLDACELLNLRDDVLLVSPNHYLDRHPDDKPDFRDYNNYFYYYDDSPLKKQNGYLIHEVFVRIADEFSAENDITPALFPEIEEDIQDICYLSKIENFKGLYDISFDISKPYTKEALDRFIRIVEYLQDLDFISEVKLKSKSTINNYPIEPRIEDWELRENYRYFNTDDKLKEVYEIDSVTVYIDKDYMEYLGGEITPDSFYEAKAKIKKVVHNKDEFADVEDCNIESYTLYFDEPSAPYTAEQVDEFINTLKYMYKLFFITNVHPAKANLEPEPVEEPTPTPTDPIPDPGNNKQTGDMLFELIAISGISALAVASVPVIKALRKKED